MNAHWCCFDACVIGGGPAGTAAAVRLAQRGFSVVVIHHGAECRRHVESLSPFCEELLKAAGLMSAGVLRVLQPVRRKLVAWHGDAVVLSETAQPHYLVERDLFDEMLLAAAVRQGVQVIRGTRADQPVPAPVGWLTPTFTRGERGEVRSRFLLDARGRSANRGGPQHGVGRTLAVGASWDGRAVGAAATMLEAAADFWVWGAVDAKGARHAVLFTDADRLRGVCRRDLPRFLSTRLHTTKQFCDCPPADGLSRVSVKDASPRLACWKPVPGSLPIGDAAYCSDPISSQGVQQAMASGLRGAAAVEIALTRPRLEEAAQAEYLQGLRRISLEHERLRAESYGAHQTYRHSPFWRARQARELGRRDSQVPPSFSPSSAIANRSNHR